jgi:hypothetical protein
MGAVLSDGGHGWEDSGEMTETVRLLEVRIYPYVDILRGPMGRCPSRPDCILLDSDRGKLHRVFLGSTLSIEGGCSHT